MKGLWIARADVLGLCSRCGQPMTGSYDSDDEDTFKMRCVSCHHQVEVLALDFPTKVVTGLEDKADPAQDLEDLEDCVMAMLDGISERHGVTRNEGFTCEHVRKMAHIIGWEMKHEDDDQAQA